VPTRLIGVIFILSGARSIADAANGHAADGVRRRFEFKSKKRSSAGDPTPEKGGRKQ
jgi:hypothetical protein